MAQAGSYLFVYGTLRRQASHQMARRLAERADYVGPAQVAGEIYDLGNYPGLVLADTHDMWVQGDLYRIDDEALWEELDRYEGYDPTDPERSLFRREICNAFSENGEAVAAFVYTFPGDVSKGKRIASGDYLKCESGHR